MPKILQNIRECILFQARGLLTKSGYELFSMRDVASLCGIGVGTLYNYFPSKQMLIVEILNAEWDVHLRRMAQLTKPLNGPKQKLLMIFSEFISFMEGVHNAWTPASVETMQCGGEEKERGLIRQRERVKGQLEAIVSEVLAGEASPEDAPWLADCISRLMLAYVSAGVGGLEPFGKALERLIV